LGLIRSSRPDAGLPAWAVVTSRRAAHVARVVAQLERWADAMGVKGRERRRWVRAAWLHDALKDAPRRVVRRLSGGIWGAPSLWHGPAAARRAERAGERDEGVLDAVRYHSVGYAGWDRVGRMLYLADYLEAGRRRIPGRRARARRVPDAPDAVLREVAAERIARSIAKGWPLLSETVDFWNALA